MSVFTLITKGTIVYLKLVLLFLIPLSGFSPSCSLVPLLQKQAAELGLRLVVLVAPGNSML